MNQTKQLILCDIDEIILNWIDKFQEYLTETGYKQIADLKHTYWVNLAYELDIDSKILVNRFNNSEDFANLDIIPNAIEGINELKELGYTLWAVSAVPNNSDTYFKRIKNLEKHFGYNPFDGISLVGTGESKYNILKNTNPKFFIEDNPQHICVANELGIITTGLYMPYNRNCDNFYGKENWEDIVKFIKDWEE